MTTESLPITSSPFDEMAADYDVAFTSTKLGTSLRSMVWNRAYASFASDARILDIGCGTGEDAVHFAKLGHAVCATDVSMAMLEVARQKAKRAGCEKRIEFRCIPMERLGIELEGERFDAAFSNFGAVNCTTRLEQVISDISKLLNPGSALLWVVMGKYVPWEWIWFLGRFDGRKAFRRLRQGGTNWRGARISYPAPAMLERMLRPDFEQISQRALGLLLPPTYASRWLDRWPKTFRALCRVEFSVGRWHRLAALADHYVMEARRMRDGANA
jgi:ubiquinone/menaquinone biosynthesis C-methylase UbiE